MPLVDYPSSDDEAEAQLTNSIQIPTNVGKRKRIDVEQDIPNSALPPLPGSFHDLYASTVRTSTVDDPSSHGGRKRKVPHMEGNWPTHVYLEWYPCTAQTVQLQQLIKDVTSGLSSSSTPVHSLLLTTLSTPAPLHVSLSAPLSLRTPQKDSFLDMLTSRILNSGVSAFSVKLGDLRWVSNYDTSRWFLVSTAILDSEQRVTKEPGAMNTLLAACNSVADAFGQPKLYETSKPIAGAGDLVGPSYTGAKNSIKRQDVDHSSIPDRSECFHISIAWRLQKPSVSECASMSSSEELKNIRVRFECVKIKVGNVVQSVALRGRRGTGMTLVNEPGQKC